MFKTLTFAGQGNDLELAESKFVTNNIYTGGPMIFVPDPKVKIVFCLFKLPLT